VPRFRQLLYVPRPGLGRPLWVDAPAFDLADHVRVVPVPAPGDEAALLRAAEQLRRFRLDRSRPLWQMWLLGLPEARAWRRAFFRVPEGRRKAMLVIDIGCALA
jgi:diacylglycerol O-acyltransferase / wax synthase